jgi:transposase
MSRPERRRLVRLGRRSGDAASYQRFHIVAMLGAGRGVGEVARVLDVAIAHVSRTQSRFLLDGIEGLYDQRRHNGRRKVEEPFLRTLAKLLVRSPPDFMWMRPTWTRELLCIEMAHRGFERVAVCTMGRALQTLGARLGRPKPIVLCPWRRERRELVLRQIRNLEARASTDEPVLYSDEVDIHKNPKVGRDWMLRGHQRRLVTPGKNEKFYIAGALDVRTGRVHAVGDFSKNSSLFCQLLFELARHFRHARRIHLVVDNYGIHKSHMTERALRELGGRIVLHFLPPYCPDHNRIERVWLDLHANVTRNHRCKTLAALLANVRAFIHAYRWRAQLPKLIERIAA